MNKAHEQTWFPAELDWRVVVDNETGAVVADIRVPAHEGGQDVAALIAASPDMARALRDGFEAFESFGAEVCDHAVNICWCAQRQALSDMRAALRKAKVLP